MHSYAKFAWLALTTGCFSPTSYDPPPAATTGYDPPPAATTDYTISATAVSTSETFTASGTSTSETSTASSTETSTTATSIGDPCGDGVLDEGEECDDNGTIDGDGCSQDCMKEYRRVFVTSQNYTGNLGGIAGADAKCQDAARNAELPGIFRAWISSSESSPAQTFVKSTVPYRDVMDVVIVDDWDALVAVESGTSFLNSLIYLTESGGVATSGPHPCTPPTLVVVWTNTNASGSTFDDSLSCTAWTGVGEGKVGRIDQVDELWTQACEVPCSTLAPVYCFEQ